MLELYKFLSADMIAEEVEAIGDKTVSFKVAINQIADSEEELTGKEKIAFLENLKEQIDKYDLVEDSIAVVTETKDRYLHVSISKF